mgnify:CR=1 FL=1
MSQPRYWVQYTTVIREAGKPDVREDCVAGFTRDTPICTFADVERINLELRNAILHNNPALAATNLSVILRSWQRFEEESRVIIPTLVQTK